MSEIDDIFKNNLDNKGIEYSEAYWQDMEKLLDREKRRKFFLKAGVVAFTLLAFLIGSVLYFAVDKVPKTPLTGHTQTPTTIAPGNNGSNRETTGDKRVESIIANQPSEIIKNAVKKENKKLPEKTPDIRTDISVIEKVESQPATVIPATPAEAVTLSGEIKNIPVEQEINERLSLLLLIPIRMESMPFENMLINYYPAFKPAGRKPVCTGEQEDSIKKLSKWQFYVAPGYEYDRYSRTPNTSLLKENEKTLDRSGFNVNVIAKKKNWGIKSGFGFLQLSELTNYVTVNKHYAFDTSYRMINPNYEQTSKGSKIALIKRNIDTMVSLSSSVNSVDSKVNFSYLKIPLMATYEFGLRQFSVFIDVGLNTSFLIHRTGNYTSFENNRYVVRNVTQNNDLNKLLFQTSASIGLKYKAGKNWNIFGGYGVSRSLNSMVKSYDQKPKINLFAFGLEIKL